MPMPLVVGMPLSEFYKLRSQYEAKARVRKEERMNHGDDTPYHQTVLEEMAIDLLAQVKALGDEVVLLKALIGAE
jgi:hypothetical protein